MFWNWWRNRRRRKLLADPFPPTWQDLLEQHVAHFHLVPDALKLRWRNDLRIFLAEKNWEGCGGLELTDAMRVTVSALATLMTLGMNDFLFENVPTILIYPREFVVADQRPILDEVAILEESERLGEAHDQGPVILSWMDVEEAARKPGVGENLVFHEFAHKLDMLNGQLDGTPKIAQSSLRTRWAEVMFREFKSLRRRARRGVETFLDPYGAEEPAEFFAVITECFFDAPKELRVEHPEIYELLKEYYRLDPSTWAFLS